MPRLRSRIVRPYSAEDALSRARKLAEAKAIAALARYKFWMFGYWAAQWVTLNRLSSRPLLTNPFAALVQSARKAVQDQDRGM